MIIEIVGVDGSGKTTLAQSLRRALNDQGDSYSYERPFQSDGVRLLEAVASDDGQRRRPGAVYKDEVIEYVRAVELVRKSFELRPYAGSRVQHVFTDSHVVEQAGRAIQKGLWSDAFARLLACALAPDLRIHLQIDANESIRRVQARPKGDALLLHANPVQAAADVIAGLDAALAVVPPPRTTVLDGARSPQDLVAEALSLIRKAAA